MRFPLWKRREKDLEEEIESHLKIAIEARMERGESAREAKEAVLREFGNVGLIKEVTRDMWGWRALEQFVQDLRFGVRMLLKNPGFTFIAVFTLALGIGANTAIFSVLYGVLLKPLPYSDPDPIVRVWQAVPTSGFYKLGFSEAQLARLRAGNQSFQRLGGYRFSSGNLTEQNETQRV